MRPKRVPTVAGKSKSAPGVDILLRILLARHFDFCMGAANRLSASLTFPFSLCLNFSEEKPWFLILQFLPLRVTNTILAGLHSFTVDAREPLKDKSLLFQQAEIPCGRGQIFSPPAAGDGRSERTDSDFFRISCNQLSLEEDCCLDTPQGHPFGLWLTRRSTRLQFGIA